ncbi:hypothetical protein [Rubellimicrobium aerolatum]|uniref:Glycosyltransferase family 4 protein n=1 Tax=Rubellimicrobium aerolatum TaxID=490979 RepID=A0ABW0S9Q3_9RHOB|nr:hypothetical protein [Rubellimicrobium aerolatum]MBP1805037.1 hypothetical protein [Rubellimicrobium aerolatum]
MDITVVVPSEDSLGLAGVRIRYDRLRPALERLGHRLEIRVIDTLGLGDPFESDAYLFCKCQDVRSVLLAQAIQAADRPVGVDIFDDYFSQEEDPRLVPMRGWLVRIRPQLRFALCATETMRERLGTIAPGLPVHVLPDPAPEFDPDVVVASVERKIARARATGRIGIGWFGTGSNKYFPVGLDDLVAWGGALTELRSAGLAPSLRVLTNRRALTPSALEGLARLPVPVHLAEWSLDREAALMDECLAVFLPVSAQPFSTVKSLNRAVTALTGGAQVWTVGHPLYADLDDFVYRSGLELARDVLTGRARLDRAALPRLVRRLEEAGDAEVEAGRLVAFLSGPAGSAEAIPFDRKAGPPMVIHGVGSTTTMHNWLRKDEILSVASPFAQPKPACDLRFESDAEGRSWAVLSEAACARIDPAFAPGLGEPFKKSNTTFRKLFLGWSPLPGSNAPRMAERIALYPAALAATRDLVARLIPGARMVLSETAAPFQEGRAP